MHWLDLSVEDRISFSACPGDLGENSFGAQDRSDQRILKTFVSHWSLVDNVELWKRTKV